MERPSFVNLVLKALLVDFLFIFGLLFAGWTALLGLFYYTPMMLAGGAQDALKWLKTRCPEDSTWSALSRAMCGSGLIYLLLVTLIFVISGPDEHNIWGILAFIYLQVLIIRFYGAGMVNIVASLICLVKGRDQIDRLSAFSALLTSGLALYLTRQLFSQPNLLLSQVGVFAGDSAVTALFFSAFLVLNFAAGLVWGTFTHWLAVKWHE